MSQEVKPTVLVVDDQENWRRALDALLKREFNVTLAVSFEEAVEKVMVQDPPFHVVVTDMRLIDRISNNVDGLKLAGHLNALGDTTKVIVVTGYGSVKTATQAIRDLAVYNYLEKSPSGEPFNRAEFLKTVRDAASEAEKQRPGGFNRQGQRVIIVERNKDWRETLVGILVKDGYIADCIEDTTTLEAKLKSNERPYGLILFDEEFAKDDFFEMLQEHNPQARVMMLTEQIYGEILLRLQTLGVMDIVTLQNENFSPQSFREKVRRSFAPDAIKYVVASLARLDGELLHEASRYKLESGIEYELTLTLQNQPVSGATSIWLSPRSDSRGRIILKVFFYAENLKLSLDSLAYWEIPPMGRPLPFRVELAPQLVQPARLVIEMEQDYRRLGRLELHIDVIEV